MDDSKDYISGFFGFMKKATTPAQTVDTIMERLGAEGFSKLDLNEQWNLSASGKYWLSPYPSMIIAFTIGSSETLAKGMRIIAAHTDNPAFRIKPNPEVSSEGMLTLNVERYGGPILNTWFDRPLSIAGRIAVKSDEVLKPKVIHLDLQRPILTIPNLAIHMNREANKGVEIKVQKEMQPLLTQLIEDEVKDNYLLDLVAKEAGVNAEDILDMDLSVYCCEEGVLVGAKGEFISCPRIDDLSMVYAVMEAIVSSENKGGINIAAFMDNEEIGSMTKQGADSVLLSTILEKIHVGIEQRPICQMKDYFVISADGAHGLHPNYGEKNDITNKPVMNKGITIKISGNRSYASEVETIAAFQQLCDKAGVNYQKFVNHSDQRGGTTLGPILSKYLPVHVVDVGVPMLAMHSTRELMGKQDFLDSIEVFRTFFQLE
ncbi:aspartyl aminopeptidase [Methanolobus vulcani]|jgi:aspartyl aminopeptidase|uniref:Probable M18 family aminopeptidase 2 n=1 Tax=Methanolobus vulcani TaxID=38026 RepID=A0A7Z7FDY3_9EURY|nr:M18 family aminopeptidase [Methanolobus vulcani]MDK2827009.1 aspartyl aminopeptidase [Methanolobus sp.]SDG39137.1 aspartyl aminopeptidase [Methanolobus vulcani]